MQLSGGGYNRHMYNPVAFRANVKALAQALPNLMRKVGADSIAVRGKSGVSYAFALQMLIDVPIMVIRKPGENSHGRDVEGSEHHMYRRYLILDDFVDSGATVRDMVHAVHVWETSPDSRPVCAGVILYHEEGGSRKVATAEGLVQAYPVRDWL